MRRRTKRGIHDKNPGKRKNHRKEVPPEKGVVPGYPVDLLHHCSIIKIVHHIQLLDNVFLNQLLWFHNFHLVLQVLIQLPHRIWTNGIRFLQPSSVMLPDGLSTQFSSFHCTRNSVSAADGSQSEITFNNPVA